MIAALEARVDALRRDLLLRHRWTELAIELVADAEARLVRCRGRVVVPRVVRELRRALSSELPAGWRLDLSGITTLRTGDYRSLLLRVTPLRQSLAGALATELAIEDGPVEVLARHDGSNLVRALDATLGWTDRELGARVPTPKLEPSRLSWDRLPSALHAFLGAPYKLGGTTRGGTDCSGLVQRVVRDTQRILLPRHSTDQLGALARASEARQTGDLVFTWTEREGPCHVGVLVVEEDPVVYHASVSRRAVVRDPLRRFVDGARRVEWAPRGAIEELGLRFAGRPGIELALLEEP
jgi:NlpC/P60 family